MYGLHKITARSKLMYKIRHGLNCKKQKVTTLSKRVTNLYKNRHMLSLHDLIFYRFIVRSKSRTSNGVYKFYARYTTIIGNTVFFFVLCVISTNSISVIQEIYTITNENKV